MALTGLTFSSGVEGVDQHHFINSSDDVLGPRQHQLDFNEWYMLTAPFGSEFACEPFPGGPPSPQQTLQLEYADATDFMRSELNSGDQFHYLVIGTNDMRNGKLVEHKYPLVDAVFVKFVEVDNPIAIHKTIMVSLPGNP